MRIKEEIATFLAAGAMVVSVAAFGQSGNRAGAAPGSEAAGSSCPAP